MKKQAIILVVILIGTFFHIFQLLTSKSNTINSMEQQLFFIEEELANYRTSLEFSFMGDSITFPQNKEYEYVIYFPKNACYICLEKLMLSMDEDVSIFKKSIIYCEDQDQTKSIEIFNDAYGTKFNFTTGISPFEKELSQIAIMKVKNNIISGVFLLNKTTQDDYKRSLGFLKL